MSGCVVMSRNAVCCDCSEHDINPLLAFAGFVSSVALVLVVVICSIALYRRTRQRQQRTGSTVLAGRKGVKQDCIVATGTCDNQRPTPGNHDVLRLTAIEDVPRNTPFKTEPHDV